MNFAVQMNACTMYRLKLPVSRQEDKNASDEISWGDFFVGANKR